jgi:hypothetical protein
MGRRKVILKETSQVQGTKVGLEKVRRGGEKSDLRKKSDVRKKVRFKGQKSDFRKKSDGEEKSQI